MTNIVLCNLPIGPKFNGGAMTAWGIVKNFLDQDITFILVLICSIKQKKTEEYNECVRILKKNKISYKIIFYKESKKNFFIRSKSLLLSLFSKPDLFFYEQVKLKKILISLLKKKNIHKIYVYHFDCLAICYDLNYEIVACLGDLIHEPRIYRRNILIKNNLFRHTLNYLDKYISMKVMLNMISKVKSAGFYANHYSEQIKKNLPSVNYFKTSIVKPKNKSFLIKRIIKKKNFLILGDLHGTVSISSFIFLEKFLKKNYSFLDSSKIKFNIVGGSKLNEINENLKKYKIIKFLGRSNNVEKHFINNNFLLVLNTIELGIRVRIITALSFGSVVISNKANAKGIPELIHKKNCLLFSTQKELISIINDLNNNKINFSRIQKNAIKTFNNNFYYPEALKDLETKILN